MILCVDSAVAEDDNDDESEDDDEEDKHGWERMEHADGGKTKVYFWDWDSGTAVWKRPPDYNTDEDANEETAEEGKRKRAAAGGEAASGEGASAGAAGGGKGEKKRGEVAKTVSGGRSDQAESETRVANEFRKMLAGGIEVSSV